MLPDDPNERHAPLGQSAPLVPPLYLSAVYTLPDLDALDRIMNQEEPGYFYARDAHPTHFAWKTEGPWFSATERD